MTRIAIILLVGLWAVASPGRMGIAWAQTNAQPKLDAAGLLPAGRNPASVPAQEGGDRTVPAVSMSEEVRQAILLFDAAGVSQRKYDLINCLDGMTFGFGNWPQGEIGDFFTGLQADSVAATALVQRMTEVFRQDPQAWRALVAAARLSATSPSAGEVGKAVKLLLADSKRENAPLKVRNDGGCIPTPAPGVSFYHDNQVWLLPAIKRAFRDPAVVAYQVRYWDHDVLVPARRYAQIMGVSGPPFFLMAFYTSNPGQAPEVQRAIRAGKAPAHLKAGGRPWSWNSPPEHLKFASTEQWQSLLLWQAMCPTNGSKFRIRNRNISYFSLYLAERFKLPYETPRNGTFFPRADRPENCNPATVKPR